MAFILSKSIRLSSYEQSKRMSISSSVLFVFADKRFPASKSSADTLNAFAMLTDIDKQAEEMFILLVKELAENENVTEQLKAENQMLWMHQMNNIHNRVMEIINTDLIYV